MSPAKVLSQSHVLRLCYCEVEIILSTHDHAHVEANSYSRGSNVHFRLSGERKEIKAKDRKACRSQMLRQRIFIIINWIYNYQLDLPVYLKSAYIAEAKLANRLTLAAEFSVTAC